MITTPRDNTYPQRGASKKKFDADGRGAWSSGREWRSPGKGLSVHILCVRSRLVEHNAEPRRVTHFIDRVLTN
jgi:hypothetical protein